MFGNNDRGASSSSSNVNKSGLGKWEAHTKGIGSKLLEKMGYKPGYGLGRNNEGIVEPIEIEANKGRGTLGTHDDFRFKKAKKSKPDTLQAIDELLEKSRLQFNNAQNEEIDSGESTDEETRMKRANDLLIEELQSQKSVEEAQLASLKTQRRDIEDSLQFQYESLAQLENKLQFFETIKVLYSDQLSLRDFWTYLSKVSYLNNEDLNHLIQAIGLKLIRKQFDEVINQSKPRMIEEEALDRLFLKDYIYVAHRWLLTEPNYNLVVDWYLEWKETLGDLLKLDTLKHFRKSLLDLMFYACTNQTRELNSFKYQQYQHKKKAETNVSEPNYFAKESTTINFKQLVEQEALRLGLEFMPLHGKTRDSKQIYRLGQRNIYLDNKVVYIKLPDGWKPKALDEVLRIC